MFLKQLCLNSGNSENGTGVVTLEQTLLGVCVCAVVFQFHFQHILKRCKTKSLCLTTSHNVYLLNL